ncbi:MAG: histidine kinase [Bacteroidales bacterium]|nr:histidine kinase [Bacteroidales bacterium]
MKEKRTIIRDILIITIISFVVSMVTIAPQIALYFNHPTFFEQLYHGSLYDLIREGIFSFLIMTLLFIANIFVFRFNDPTQKIGKLKIVLSFITLYIVAVLLRELSEEIIFSGLVKAEQGSRIAIYSMTHWLRDLITTVVVFFASYAIYLSRRQNLMVVQNQKLQTESAKNQYESLKNQLNPHMLFNSLNTLSTLVDESVEKSKEYIHELSYVLRYTLQESENYKVDLQQEIDYSNAYIFLQQMRYEDSLSFNVQVSGTAKRKQVSPMSLQLLIENAIKHNQISSKKPLAINICTVDDEWLIVSNTIQPKFNITNARTTGIGLENLNKRYMLLFDKEIEVDKGSDTFTVKIPLIEPDKE